MAVRLNQRAYDQAREPIAVGRCVIDDRDAWGEHQPSARRENAFIERRGIAQYARWHPGLDDDPLPAARRAPRRTWPTPQREVPS